MDTHKSSASKFGLEDLEAPARDLTAAESGEVQGGGGVILERGGSLTSDGGTQDGIMVPDAKSGGGTQDGVIVPESR